MAWIRTIKDGDAEGRLAELYARVADPQSGRVDHILAVHSLHPRGLEAHFEFYRAVMAGSAGLRKVDRELVAYAVSRINGCHY